MGEKLALQVVYGSVTYWLLVQAAFGELSRLQAVLSLSNPTSQSSQKIRLTLQRVRVAWERGLGWGGGGENNCSRFQDLGVLIILILTLCPHPLPVQRPGL